MLFFRVGWAAKRRCPPYDILINLRFFYFVKQKKLDHRVIEMTLLLNSSSLFAFVIRHY